MFLNRTRRRRVHAYGTRLSRIDGRRLLPTMGRSYGNLAKRLQDSLARGVLKLRIDTLERRISSFPSAAPESSSKSELLNPRFKPLLREFDGLLGGALTLAPLSGSGLDGGASGKILGRFGSTDDALRCRPVGASSVAKFQLNDFAVGLSPSPGRRIREMHHGIGLGLAATAAATPMALGRASLCSGARAGAGAAASSARASARRSLSHDRVVRGDGDGDGSVAGKAKAMGWARAPQAGQERSQSMLLYLLAMVVGVVGVTYASVPLYRRFCQATGYGGTVQRRETVEGKIARHGAEEDASRELVVHFNADVADSMPWKFTPCQNQVRTKVGQSTLAFYTAENTSSDDITGVSTYNVAPMQAGAYFNKIQCFCFEEQRLRPGERIDMPVLFYIDPEFAADPKMDSINSLILSYTFFKVDDEDEDE